MCPTDPRARECATTSRYLLPSCNCAGGRQSRPCSGAEVVLMRRCSHFEPFPCNACLCSTGCTQLLSLPPSPTDVSHLSFSTSTPCRHICFLKSCKWSCLVAVLFFYPDMPLLLLSRRKKNPLNLAKKSKDCPKTPTCVLNI